MQDTQEAPTDVETASKKRKMGRSGQETETDALNSSSTSTDPVTELRASRTTCCRKLLCAMSWEGMYSTFVYLCNMVYLRMLGTV